VKRDRLHAELADLFGRGVLHQSRLTDPADLELTAEQMDAVHDAADELLGLRGNPKAQVELVRSLDPQTRLTLCMWTMDTGLMDSLLLRVVAPVVSPVPEVSR
jgi:hypothetical protein